MKRLSAVLTAVVAGLLLTLAVAAPASAHTSLIDVTPGEESTVKAGDAVTLTFSEDLLTIGAEATATDSEGTVTALEVTFPMPSSVRVMLPDLAGGSVLIAWRVVANDGHPIEGALTFIAEAPTTSQAADSADPVAASEQASSVPVAPPSTATPTAEPGDTPSADATTENSGPPVALWIAIGAALLAFGAVMLARNKRP